MSGRARHLLPSAAADPVLDDLLEEFAQQLEAGEAVDPAAFAAAHPERADELRRMLPVIQVLAGLEHSGPEASPPGVTAAPAALGALGDFRIVREVGRGGMGVVYEAEQISLGRRVALKVLPFAAALDGRQLQRFKNEAQAAAGLHHGHIVPVYGVGTERGVHYYAMQFIEGQTLAQLIAGLRPQPERPAAGPDATTGPPAPLAGRAAAERERTAERPNAPAAGSASATGEALPPYVPPYAPAPLAGTDPAREASTVRAAAAGTAASAQTAGFFRTAADLGRQAAEALEHAHLQGVIHRDVKPANLLVDGRGHLWVTDFGLAHCQNQAGLTMTGDLLGTLRYMSPEQALAQRVVIDHRTDIYSLGATLYELLTLEPAFGGSDRQELLRQIAFEEPRPPRRVNRAVPAELETIVLKALEKNPNDRYPTAQELADDLRRFLEDRPIRARRPSLVQRLRKWSWRHRAVVTSAVVSLLALLALVVVGLAWSNVRISEERDRKDEALRAKEQEAAVTRAVNEFLQKDLLGQADIANQAPALGGPAERNPNVTVRELLDRAAKTIKERFGGQPRTEAALRLTIGDAYRALGRFKQAEDHLQESVKRRTRLLGAGHPDTLASKKSLAWVYLEQHQFAKAEPLLREVVQARTARLGADHPDTLASQDDLASFFAERGQLRQAERLFREVLKARTAKLGPDHPDTLASAFGVGVVCWKQDRYKEAERLLREVLERRTAKLGADHPDTLLTKCNLAMAYLCQDQYDPCERLLREVVRVSAAKLGPNHPTTLFHQNNLAITYQFQGRYADAGRLYRANLRAYRAKYGEDYWLTMVSKANLANLYDQQGHYAQAEPLFREALQSQKRVHGAKGDNDVFFWKTNLATMYRHQARYAEAEALLREVLKARMTILGANHSDTLATKRELATLYTDQRRYDRAEPLLLETVKACTARLGPADSDTLTAQNRLAELYLATRRYDEAEALLRKVLKARKAKLGAEHPDTLTSKHDLASLYQARGREEQAEPLFLAVLQARTAKLGAEHPDTLASKEGLARLYVARRRYGEAERRLLEVYEGLKARQADMPVDGKARLAQAAGRLARLYDAWGKKDQAGEWRKRAEEVKAAAKARTKP
jgi:serine/threonine protein kinase